MRGFYCTRVEVDERLDQKTMNGLIIGEEITLTVTLQSSGDTSWITDVALTHLVGSRIMAIDIESSEILL